MAMNVDIGMKIPDAGYPSDKALDELFVEGIPFLSRLKPNRKPYKSLIEAYGHTGRMRWTPNMKALIFEGN